MKDRIVSVHCPLSQLHSIMMALSLASVKSNLHASCIEEVCKGHEEDPNYFPFPFYVETVDCAEQYRKDHAEYEYAYGLAVKLFVNGLEIEPLDDAPEFECDIF